MTRHDAMSALRNLGAPDATIAAAVGLTRQEIHRRLGPRPRRPPTDAPTEANCEDVTDFAPRIKAWRHDMRLTQEEAAELIGVNVYTLRNWEQGKPAPFARLILLTLSLLKRT